MALRDSGETAAIGKVAVTLRVTKPHHAERDGYFRGAKGGQSSFEMPSSWTGPPWGSLVFLCLLHAVVRPQTEGDGESPNTVAFGLPLNDSNTQTRENDNVPTWRSPNRQRIEKS